MTTEERAELRNATIEYQAALQGFEVARRCGEQGQVRTRASERLSRARREFAILVQPATVAGLLDQVDELEAAKRATVLARLEAIGTRPGAPLIPDLDAVFIADRERYERSVGIDPEKRGGHG